MHGSQVAAVVSRGWMSFTLATGALLELGGASATVPTAQLSPSNFLAAGIPQNAAKSAFADPGAAGVGADTNGHTIKHMRFTVISVAVAATPAARFATSGSTPTASLGAQVLTGDGQMIPNSRQEIFNFKLFNRSAGNMVVEVEVWE
jgi:hypothetical protein